MNFRVLVIVIIVVLVLLIVVVMVGGTAARETFFPRIDLQGRWAEWTRSRLTQPVESSELTLAVGPPDGCRIEAERLVIRPDTRCTFAIQAADDSTRQLPLRLTGISQTIGLTMAQENALTVSITTTSGSPAVRLDVYQNAERKIAQLTVDQCQLPQAKDEAEDERPPTQAASVCILEIRP
jgi:hypothetical protein